MRVSTYVHVCVRVCEYVKMQAGVSASVRSFDCIVQDHLSLKLFSDWNNFSEGGQILSKI